MTYRRIVAGTDGSATAAIAVRHAAGLAAACDAELLIVTAFRPGRVTEAPDDVPEDLEWTVSDAAVAEAHVAAAAELAAECGVAGGRLHVVAAPGDPADVLVEVAETRGADVIVVGSKGMNSASRFLLGSVPNKVAHHAPCDVLIVKTVA